MRRISLNSLCLCALALFSSLTFGQVMIGAERQTVEMDLYEGPDVTNKTHYGNCQWLYPLDEPNEPLAEQPDYRSARPYCYAARYGDARDNTYTIVLDESGGTGTGYDTVYADVNNDNRIDPKAEMFPFQLGTTRHAEPVRIRLTVSAGGRTFPYSFEFTAFPYKGTNHPIEKIHANCRNSSIFVGRAVFDGEEHEIGIADLNSNGLFNDTEQGLFRGDRFFVDFDGDGSFQSSNNAESESYSYGRYTKIAGKWYTVKARPDGQSIEIAVAQPELATVKAPRGIGTVDLHSPAQSLHLVFSDGSAQAITGTYKVASVQLSLSDSRNRVWTASGSFREEDMRLHVKPDADVQLPEMLPLTVSVEPTGEAPFAEVSLSAKIVSPAGGAFRTARSAGRPSGGFEIQDADGKRVAGADFEYG